MAGAVWLPSRLVCKADLPAVGTTTAQSRKAGCNMLKHICQTFMQLANQVCSFPKAVANVIRHRRQQVVLNELEAERLDRIRNPSKYLGK